jgi:hypothetical protein
MKILLLSIVLIAVTSRTTADPVVNLKNYNREAFGGWADSDGDCQNTRHELLIARSLRPAELRTDGCLVLRGSWIDPYSAELQRQASEVDIDHLVPLKFAWDHGAWDWSRDKQEQFANDPFNLVITQKSLNRSKGSDGPLNWLPPNDGFKCAYLERFLLVLERYSLVLLRDELDKFSLLRANICVE